jgi:ABC-type lipoprotein export system ATPase subunit
MLLDLQRSRQNVLIVVTHNPDLAAKFPVRLEVAGKNLKKV